MRISGTDIYIAKGDKADLTLSFDPKQLEGVEQDGCVLHIGKNEIIGNIEGWDGENTNLTGVVTFSLMTEREEVKEEEGEEEAITVEAFNLSTGEHHYDIVLTINDKTTTIIRKSLFVVEETARTQSDPRYSYTGSNKGK